MPLRLPYDINLEPSIICLFKVFLDQIMDDQ